MHFSVNYRDQDTTTVSERHKTSNEKVFARLKIRRTRDRESERVVHYKREREKTQSYPFLFPFLCLNPPSFLFLQPPSILQTRYKPLFFWCIRHAFIHHQPPRKSQRREKTETRQQKQNAKRGLKTHMEKSKEKKRKTMFCKSKQQGRPVMLSVGPRSALWNETSFIIKLFVRHHGCRYRESRRGNRKKEEKKGKSEMTSKEVRYYQNKERRKGTFRAEQVVLYRCPARTERGRPIPALPSRTVFLRLRPFESSL